MNNVNLSGYINWINYNKNANPRNNVLNMYVRVYAGYKDKFTNESNYYSIMCSAFGSQADYVYNHFKKDDSIEIVGSLCNKPYIDKKTNEKKDSYYVRIESAYYPPINNKNTSSNNILIENDDDYEVVTPDDILY